MTLHASMTEALRRTRAGDLAGATALLRDALKPTHAPAPPSPTGTASGLLDLLPGRKQAPGPATSPRTTPAEPAGAQFDEHVYPGGVGRMHYRLYVPAGATPGMPLIVMLHGCTQSPEDFARGTGMNRLADALGFLVAYPRQTQSANPQKCWNWFKPGDQHRDRGEPALLAGVTRQVIAEHGVDAERVYVAGLSAGGAAAAILAAEYPDLFAAAGIHSGLACGAARDLPSALSAMQRGGGSARTQAPGRRFVPVITFHGDRDQTVHATNSREIVDSAAAAAGSLLRVRTEEGRSDGGTAFQREMHVDAAGVVQIEHWTITGAGHAWAGGDPTGSYTDPKGPDASREMVRFFLERKRGAAA
jgi:poly(hydroxyalkanoate) depolymerase family esterase